jgi:hypothetical protein
MAQFEAARCFYTALSFAMSEQHIQAYSLMDRAVQRVESAMRKWKARPLPCIADSLSLLQILNWVVAAINAMISTGSR